jgi:hypothetical protein
VWAFIGVGIFPVSIHDCGVLSVRNCRVGFRRVRIYPVTHWNIVNITFQQQIAQHCGCYVTIRFSYLWTDVDFAAVTSDPHSLLVGYVIVLCASQRDG